MAKRQVPVPETETMEPAYEPTAEEMAQWEEDREREREARLAPCKAMHEQQNDQDDLLAELLFEVDLLRLGIDE